MRNMTVDERAAFCAHLSNIINLARDARASFILERYEAVDLALETLRAELDALNALKDASQG